MSIVGDWLNSCIDSICGPSGLSDPASDIHSTPLQSTVRNDDTVSFHNHFGTSADYQQPAESGNFFQSDDWTSSGSNFGSDFGGSGFDL